MIICRLILIFILLISFSYTNSSIAKMYKWTDENGVIHFSDTPPPDEDRPHDTYETSPTSPDPPESESDKNETDASPSDNSSDVEEIVNLTIGDIFGKWKFIGVSPPYSSAEISKPKIPQSWQFKGDGNVVYTIGNRANAFPYKIQGKSIVTTPYANQKKIVCSCKNITR